MIGVSLASAFASAVSSSLQHLSAGQVPDGQDLGADVVGLSLQVLTLHLGALAVVQLLLMSGLLLTPRESWRSRPTATRRSSTAVTVAGADRRWVFYEQSDRVHTDPAVLGDPQGHIELGPMTLLAEQLVGGGDAGPPCAGVRLQRVLVRDQPVGCAWSRAGLCISGHRHPLVGATHHCLFRSPVAAFSGSAATADESPWCPSAALRRRRSFPD